MELYTDYFFYFDTIGILDAVRARRMIVLLKSASFKTENSSKNKNIHILLRYW